MKDAQTILDKVSIFFSELVGAEQMPPVSGEPAAVKMIEAKLKDGTTLQTETTFIIQCSDLACDSTNPMIGSIDPTTVLSRIEIN